MNTTTQPQVFQRIIAVRLTVQDSAILPGNNYIGALMLDELIHRALEDQNMGKGGASRGPLNSCLLAFEVGDVGQAYKIIEAILERLHLLTAADIAWHDEAELVWRPLRTYTGIPMEKFFEKQ